MIALSSVARPYVWLSPYRYGMDDGVIWLKLWFSSQITTTWLIAPPAGAVGRGVGAGVGFGVGLAVGAVVALAVAVGLALAPFDDLAPTDAPGDAPNEPADPDADPLGPALPVASPIPDADGLPDGLASSNRTAATRTTTTPIARTARGLKRADRPAFTRAA